MAHRHTTVVAPPPPPVEYAFETNEIKLFGERLPVVGTIRRKSVTPFPAKTTSGDYNVTDLVIQSQKIVSDWTGGVGILHARSGRDLDRYALGNLDGRYRFLTLPPEVIDASVTSTATRLTEPTHMIGYDDTAWALVGMSIYRWDGVNSRWVLQTVDADTTLSGTEVRDVTVYDGSLYVLTDTTLYRYTGTAWTNQNVGGYALGVWDDKLWLLSTTNTISWALTSSITTWSTGGTLRYPVGWCRQLIVFFDQTGSAVLHAITRVGVFAYDFDTAKFFPTPLQHPYIDSAGKGACVWQGSLYIPVGSSIYRYAGNVIQVMGPDKDEGLPPPFQGDILQVLAGYGFLYATLNADTAGTGDPGWLMMGADVYADTFTADWTGHSFYTAGSTVGALLTSPGSAWHILAQHPRGTAITAMTAAAIIGTSDWLRVWWSDTQGIYYSDVPSGLHNPLQRATVRYAPDGYAYTSWMDMDWGVIDKVALDLIVETNPTRSLDAWQAGNEIKISVGYDDHPDLERVATITQAGRHIYQLGGSDGRIFHNIRFYVEMKRGPNATDPPVLEEISVGFMRAPRQLDGWELTLDLTEERCRSLAGVGARDLIERLYDWKRHKRAGFFSYRDLNDQISTRRIWLHEVIGVEMAGKSDGGRYSIMLLELDNWRDPHGEIW